MKINISLAATINFSKLKKNPVKIAKELTLSQLITLVKQANVAYHNTGSSKLTDAQYDIIKDEIRERRPDHSILKTIGAFPTGRSKVKLPYPLFSLDKIKPNTESFTKWHSTHEGPYVVSDKEDGLSIETIYEKGIPTKAYTRGNGTIGQDVTHLIPYLEIPHKIPYKKKFVVRKEAAMTEQAFNKHFSKENSTTSGKKYENARNLVAGIVNTLNKKHEALDHIHTIAYEIIEPRMKPSQALAILKKYGFHVVPYKLVEDISESWLSKYLTVRKSKSPVNLDGLVVEQDKKTIRPVAGNPDYAVAFKAEQEGDIVDVKVLTIEWEETQYGKLNPVVLIDPVRLDGVTVKKANGFNAKFIETGYRQKESKIQLKPRPIGPGAVIRIKRSGGVIPHIISVVTPAKRPSMPTIPYEYTRSGVDIKLKVNSDLVRAKRITNFFTTLKVDNIKLGVVQKLMDYGLTTILKIIKAKPRDFLKVEGFKERSAQKLYDSIQDKISKPIPLAILMKASGHFEQGMGERRFNEILKVYPNILEDHAKKGEKYILDKVIAIPGFQERTALVFVRGIPGFIKWLTLSKLKAVTKAPTVKTTSKGLEGQAVAFTGFRDSLVESKIKAASGTVTNGVTKETTILLVPSTAFTSSKVEKAQKQGIKILPVDNFIKKYKL